MSANVTGLAGEDTTHTDLMPNVNGQISGGAWHHGVHPNTYAWVYIVGALGLLWLTGAHFK